MAVYAVAHHQAVAVMASENWARNANRRAIVLREKIVLVVSARQHRSRYALRIPIAERGHAATQDSAQQTAEGVEVAQSIATAPEARAAIRTPVSALQRHAACSVPPE